MTVDLVSGADLPGGTYDDGAVLAAASAVRNYCGWHIAPSVTETVTVDGSGSALLLLPTLHVTAVVEVLEDTVLLVNDTDFSWSTAGILTRGYWPTFARWSSFRRSVVVEFTHGFPTCPPEIAALVARLAKIGIHGRSGTVRVGDVSVGATPDQAAGVLGLDLYAQTILNRYRVPRF